MSARRPLPRLPLTGNLRCLRHQWCDERWTWTTEWNDIVFTDESRFCLQHLDGQDNARPHLARNVQGFFFIHQIELLPRPACSLDILPFENVWSMLAQRLWPEIHHPILHQINFGNMWKLHRLLYPKDTSKASLILCRGVWQRL
ncbi:transposable element Tcb1 transposase [Trichonephila clavipes]|nr:transposable element Tcb1 transposase [Trichonephila clavipes]